MSSTVTLIFLLYPHEKFPECFIAHRITVPILRDVDYASVCGEEHTHVRMCV